jgi:hypothetical protein
MTVFKIIDASAHLEYGDTDNTRERWGAEPGNGRFRAPADAPAGEIA